jgi:hypothetical protein
MRDCGVVIHKHREKPDLGCAGRVNFVNGEYRETMMHSGQFSAGCRTQWMIDSAGVARMSPAW